MTGQVLRGRFLEYFQSQSHSLLPSASLVPSDDPTVLFTTAGMQPLVPYLRGEPHPLGRRLASAQKCLRTDDLDAVGDASHLTFFEMLGNWSLGDYFKERAIAMSFEFLTSDRWLGVPVEKLAITCFAGDALVPRDDESARFWRQQGIPKDRIFYGGRHENWWGPPAKTGPCGPDTEIFFDTGKAGRAPNDGTERFVEIWNDVFMQYEQTADGSLRPLPQKNVDTGMGLERAAAVLQGLTSVYATDLFAPIFAALGANGLAEDRDLRIAADHLRAAVFVLADPRGIRPSNVEHGYVLRRLLRRAFRALELRGATSRKVENRLLGAVADSVARTYGEVYPEVRTRRDDVVHALSRELGAYAAVRERAERELAIRQARGEIAIDGREAFNLYQSRGFHPDLLGSIGGTLGITVDLRGFEEEWARHQVLSRAGEAKKFSGGLADHSEPAVKLHTATHLLQSALRRVLGTHVEQKGSNITSERLRFDFSHPRKLTEDELRRVENLVNEQIRRDLPVTRSAMTLGEAKAGGALGLFGERYGEKVSVYAVGDFSREICGGPHVDRTGRLGRFRITKEEGLAAGVRRIRAVVE